MSEANDSAGGRLRRRERERPGEENSHPRLKKSPVRIRALLNGVPAGRLAPREAWKNASDHDAKYAELAGLFDKNFKKFEVSNENIVKAGPKTA